MLNKDRGGERFLHFSYYHIVILTQKGSQNNTKIKF